MSPSSGRRRVGVVLFDGFELLDVCGPLEIYGHLPDEFDIAVLGPQAEPVRSAHGPAMLAERPYREAEAVDVAFVPGGIGTRGLAADGAFLAWLADWASRAEVVSSVCTGAGLLAGAGLLDGYRATSNKRAFSWVCSQGPKVDWVAKARWVNDRNRWTSAGVAAGIDMTLALVARLCSPDVAAGLADAVEYDWHRDPEWDPFAAKNGLVEAGET